MKSFLTLAILLSAAVFPAFGEESPGNIAFAAKNYTEAASAYQDQINKTGPNANLLYNLGNARYRLGEFGAAIHAYEQALVLDPHSSDIQTNLRLAREAATAFEENEPARWEKPAYWLSLNQWYFAGLGALGTLAIASLWRGVTDTSTKRTILHQLTVVSVSAFIVSVAVISIRQSETKRAIVISSEAKVRLSPFETADVVATVSAGKAVQIKETHGNFCYVGSGWIAKDAVAPVYFNW